MSEFRNLDDPAFLPGEKWICSNGSVVIVHSVNRYGDGKWAWDVVYSTEDGLEFERNGWTFQVRFEPIKS